MDNAQVELILAELAATRKSFDDTRDAFAEVVKTIRWNKVNTIIQYVLILIVSLMLFLMGVFYFKNRKDDCIRSNEFRTSVNSALDNHALGIGIAVATVAGGSPEDVEAYMDVYNQQPKAPVLALRSC